MRYKERNPIASESNRKPPRRAVTLLEVLLVLIVLSLVAAATWPSLERSFADQRLRDAADLVRAEWSSARAKAMESGVDYRFRYTLEDRRFWIEECQDTGSLGNGLDSATALGSGAHEETLPEEVVFHEGEVKSDSTEEGADTMPGDGEVDPGSLEGGESGAAIVFRSDGTCSSAKLVLRNEYDRGITVTIRGLTGMSEARDISPIEGRTL